MGNQSTKMFQPKTKLQERTRNSLQIWQKTIVNPPQKIRNWIYIYIYIYRERERERERLKYNT